MRPVSARIGRPINVSTVLNVADNSGARLIKVIGVHVYHGVKKRYPSAGIGDIIVASVKAGKPELRKQVVLATIIRQKKEFRRPDGTRVKFEDNAAVLLSDDLGTPKGTRIKGAVAREVVERFSAIGKISSIV